MTVNCKWPLREDLLPAIDTEDEAEVSKLQACADTAVYILWALTARRFGCRDVTVRPYPYQPDWLDSFGYPSLPGVVPTLYGGSWYNLPSPGCPGEDDGPAAVTLPGPVAEVKRILVDGEEFPDTKWRREGNTLYRLDGKPWPRQDMRSSFHAPGTWAVLYSIGEPPPSGADLAVATLTTELWNALTPGSKCRLPRGWSTVTKGGVTITRPDPAQVIGARLTGLPEVDQWVKQTNPNGLMRQTKVLSPDLER